MNRFLNLFLAFTILVLCTSMVFAIGGKDSKNPQSTQLLQREVIGDDANENIRPPHIDTYVMPKSRGKVALAGTYTIGLLNTGLPTNFDMLRDAVAALQAEGVSAPVTFLFTDVSYTDTGQTIGGYVGQGPGNLVTFKPATGVVMNLKFSGGTGTASYTGLSGGFNFRTASGIVLDGSNSGGDDRSWTIECDTVGVNVQGRAPLGMTRGCNNITVKNMVVKGNRRSTSNAYGLISNDNLTFGAFGPQFNITYHNNHFKQGNAIAYVRAAGSGELPGFPADYNYTFTNNIFGGQSSTQVLDHLATGLNLQENVNNVLIDNNDFYGIKIVGNPILVSLRGGNAGVVVSNNKFHNIVTLSGAARPICLLIGNVTSTGTGIAPRTTAKIFNNMFYDIHSYGAGASRGFNWITYNATGPPNTPNGTGSTVEYYHNTLNLNLAAGETGGVTAFIFDGNFAGGGTTYSDQIVIKNNIFSSIRADFYTRTYLMFTEAAPGMLDMVANYNLYYQVDAGAFAQFPSPWPSGGAVVESYDNWKLITGFDANSKGGQNPLFVSTTSAHISTAIGDASPANAMGIDLVPPILSDIDGQLRAGLTPVDVGADAFTPVPWDYDAYPISVLGPNVEGIKVNADAYPKVRVKNNGANVITIPVRVKVLGTPYDVVENVLDVPEFSTADYTFTTPFNSAVTGEYTIEVTTEYIGDQNPGNNGPITRGLYVVNDVTVPLAGYFNDFDAVSKATGLVQGGWLSAVTSPGPDNWLLGTPAKATINSAYSGTNSFVTGPLNANYVISWTAAVYSPFMNLSAFNNPIVRFALAYKTEPEWDAVIFEYSLDGNTWVRAFKPNAINWYNMLEGEDLIFGPPAWSGAENVNPGGWRIATITLPELANQGQVRFRLNFGSDGAEVDEGVAFDNFQIVDGSFLSGMKFLDINKNEAKDAGEPGVEGWGINLTSSALPTPYLTQTDADGNYEFSENLIPGEYTLFEDEVVGWVQTYPTGLIKQHEVTITTPGTFGDLDFGNYFTNASIAGLVYEDVNGNGTQDAGELGLEGWDINLTGAMVNSATTNANGEYLFASLEPGDYNVAVVGKAGWNLTSTPASYDVTLLEANQAVTDRNFGEFKLALISGAVYLDFNRNGVLDAGEPGVNNVTVNLAASNPLNDKTTTTAGGGLYSFTSGIETYTETIVVPAGKYIVAPVSGNYAIAVTSSGMVIANKDFGLSSEDDAVKYRSFIHQDVMSLDPKSLKPVKAIKKKAFQVEQIINLTAPAGKTDLHIEFGGAVYQIVVIEKNGIALVNPDDYTMTGAIDGKNKKFDFVFVAPLAGGDVITVHVYLKGSKPLKLKYYWTPYVKGEPKYALGTTDPAFELNQPRLPMPNYINLLAEVYPKGGTGMLVGTAHPEAPKDYGWLQMPTAKDIYKTLWDKTGYHDGTPRFFDVFSNSGKPLVKLQKSLPPTKHDNALLAEIIALKLAITASASGYTEDGGGFGELIYQDTGNALNGKMVKEIADEASAAMTSKIGDAANYYEVIFDINRAFAGIFDTVGFAAKTVLTGTVALGDVPFLRAPITPITRNTPTDQKYADVPDVFELQQNYPNPFNPTTTISFILPEDAIVTLKIYNTIGQEVATLANKELYTEGMNELEFDASRLSSGIYFYQMTANGVGENAGKFSTVKKMVLMK